MPEALKAVWQVRVGLWPGEVESMKDRHRQWFYTSADYEADCVATRGETKGPHPEKPPTIFETRRKEATTYWEQWNEPSFCNWAELSFTWV